MNLTLRLARLSGPVCVPVEEWCGDCGTLRQELTFGTA
jgi:hypothetical protein